MLGGSSADLNQPLASLDGSVPSFKIAGARRRSPHTRGLSRPGSGTRLLRGGGRDDVSGIHSRAWRCVHSRAGAPIAGHESSRRVSEPAPGRLAGGAGPGLSLRDQDAAPCCRCRGEAGRYSARRDREATSAHRRGHRRLLSAARSACVTGMRLAGVGGI